MRLAAAAMTAVLALSGSAVPAHAGAPEGPAFVAAFAEACVPQRLSYPGTLDHAKSAGWSEVAENAHPELDAVLAAADRETKEMAEDGWTFERASLSREVGGRKNFLIVTRVHAPEIITLIGCYLYDFDASAEIDPQPVSDLIGNPIGRTVEDKGLLQYTWGPNPARPRTLDTNLSFIAEDSPHTEVTGFSGLVLKFETSEPDAQEGSEKSE